MPINLDGLSTQSKETIEKLRKVEEKKLLIYELQAAELEFQNSALEELRKKSRELQISLESLYNFDSPFEKRSLESTPEGFITGVANKNAAFGRHSIIIKNLATRLAAASKGLPANSQIGEGDFTVNGKTAHFKGGNLDQLKTFLAQNFNDMLTPKIVQKSSSESILILESMNEGEKGILELSDTSGFFKQSELVRDPAEVPSQPVKAEKVKPSGAARERYIPVPFSLELLSVLKEGPTAIGENQMSLTLGEASARRLEIPVQPEPGEKIKSLTLEIFSQVAPAQPVETDTTPTSLTDGPIETINIKGIILNSYNITRTREKKELPRDDQQDFDFGIILPDGAQQSLKGRSGLISVPLSETPAYIDFYTSKKEVVYKNLQLVFSAPKDEKPLDEKSKELPADGDKLAEQKARFPHLIKPAANAVLNVDGIDVDRDSNNGLKDIIDGATLDLKKPSDIPVEVSLTANLKKSQEMMADFIKKYNDLLDFTKTISSGVKQNAEGQIETLTEEETKKTPLIASSLVRSMVTGMQNKVSNVYPAILEPKIKILQMLGIGTGKPNSSWQEISQMHLQFEDKDLFDEMVSKYPTAVKDFFGQDKNGDRSFDDGMAFQMVEFLKAYTTQLKKGLIQAQIGTNQDRIKYLKETREKKAAAIEEYEKKLRAKFGRMESVIQESKSTGDSLRQRFNNGN